MNPDSKIMDDIARVAGGAVNVVSGMQQQLREEIKTRLEEMVARMDLVPRDDFDQVQAMITKLRLQIDSLEGRVKKLESKKATTTRKVAKKTGIVKKAKKKT